jgi:hypothetical protein
MKALFNWLTKLSFREKALFYCALFLVGGVLLDKFMLQPFLEDLNKIYLQTTSITDNLSKDFNYTSSENKKLIQQEYDVYKQYFSIAQPKNTTDLSKMVQDMAIKSNVAPDKITPVASRDSIRRISLQLDCVGDRKNILDFIYSLSTSDIFLRLDKITISPKKEDFAVTIILSLIPLQSD